MSEDEIGDSDDDLSMPVVVCASRGGPYDDASFIAGACFGQITQWIEDGMPLREGVMYRAWKVPAQVFPQLDLLAMQMELDTETWVGEDPEWVFVVLKPAKSTRN